MDSLSTWCKICGIGSKADALAAERAGADAIGMNFYASSPRLVAVQTAAEIADSVSCLRVGLFVDADPGEVVRVVDSCQLDLLQFHGGESPRYCTQFKLPYIKVLRMRADTDVGRACADYGEAWAILLDSHVAGRPGGTGQRFDWKLWPGNVDAPLILAGGLNSRNVGRAIRTLQPFGVDVAGGVEGSVKGVKDHALIGQFVQEVRSVERQ